MKNQNELSREQLELQARIAQRRIEMIERVLSSGVQEAKSEHMDKDTAKVIMRLYDTSLSDADISSCISILEMLLLLEALPPLLAVMKNASYSIPLRRQAAEAIAKIGSSAITKDLTDMLSSDSAELRSFAEIALKR